jgi:hypothetical protein
LLVSKRSVDPDPWKLQVRKTVDPAEPAERTKFSRKRQFSRKKENGKKTKKIFSPQAQSHPLGDSAMGGKKFDATIFCCGFHNSGNVKG